MLVQGAQDVGAPAVKRAGEATNPEDDDFIAVVKNLSAGSEQDLRARCSSYGTIIWIQTVGQGCFMVRYGRREEVAKFVSEVNGSVWNGQQVSAQPFGVAPIPGASIPRRQDSIYAILEPQQLAYIDSILTDEALSGDIERLSQSHSSSHAGGGLEPLAAECTPTPGEEALCQPLEPASGARELPPSPAPMTRHESTPFSPGVPMVSPFLVRAPTPSDPGAKLVGDGDGATGEHLPSLQLWTQKSIGAAARADMKRFAVMQNIVSSHSGRGAWAGHSGPGSPMASHASSMSEAVAPSSQQLEGSFVGSRGGTPLAMMRSEASAMDSMSEGGDMLGAVDSAYSSEGGVKEVEAVLAWRARPGSPDRMPRYGSPLPGLPSTALPLMGSGGSAQWSSPVASPRAALPPHAAAFAAAALHQAGSPLRPVARLHARLPQEHGSPQQQRPRVQLTSQLDPRAPQWHGSPAVSPSPGTPGAGGAGGQQAQWARTASTNSMLSSFQDHGAAPPASTTPPLPAPLVVPHLPVSSFAAELLTLLEGAGAGDGNACLATLHELLGVALAGSNGTMDVPTFLGLLREATAQGLEAAGVSAAAAALAAAAAVRSLRSSDAGNSSRGSSARVSSTDDGAEPTAGGGIGAGGRPGLPPIKARVQGGSNGGAMPGSPQCVNSPSFAMPTAAELAGAKAALQRLVMSAHALAHAPAFGMMCGALGPIADLYDRMHDLPVVQKRKRCAEMAGHRARITQDANFNQVMQQASTLRNHIYSLSRKVLLGCGHTEGLPLDLFLGGIGIEMGHIFKAEQATGTGLPQHVLDYFGQQLPHPRLALLVFAEFVGVDPQPVGASALAAAAAAATTPTAASLASAASGDASEALATVAAKRASSGVMEGGARRQNSGTSDGGKRYGGRR